MRLAELIGMTGLALETGVSVPDRDVGAIRYDSRRILPGDLFVAVPGTMTDGHEHVPAAIAAGACAVVVERQDACVTGVPCFLVPSSRVALADLAAARHGMPARYLRVYGVTGTDGKTTSTFLLSHVLEGMGRRSGLLSTVAFKIGDRWEDNLARQSTLEAPEIQEALADMVRAGVEDAVIEATSHGLVLDRVRHCAFDAALITNVTSEHLDFHGTRERYLDAKALLLQALLETEDKTGSRVAAINVDDEGSASLIPRSPVPVVGFGLSAGAEMRATDIRSDANGSTFTVELGRERHAMRTALPGQFNIYNCLGVLALLHGRGVDLAAAAPHLETFAGVPGRMRRVDEGQPFTVVVDYAHTAASLEKVLHTLRPLTRGRLIAVFGSAGDRDREKRPVMGGVAARFADFSIFTDEDPRFEPRMLIIEAIARGARAAGAQEGNAFICIPDRAVAITHAVELAVAGDVVLLAGKGHEHSMLVRGQSLPWDEEQIARNALRALGYGC